MGHLHSQLLGVWGCPTKTWALGRACWPIPTPQRVSPSPGISSHTFGNAPVEHSAVIHFALVLGGEEWGRAWAEGGKGQSQGHADPEHAVKWDL